MKKAFRILAIVLAATMLMCCCAFATASHTTGTRYLDHIQFASGYGTAYGSCSCSDSNGAGTTSLDVVGPNREVSITFGYWYYDEDGYINGGSDGDSMSNVSGDVYASAGIASGIAASSVTEAHTTAYHYAGNGSGITNRDYYR